MKIAPSTYHAHDARRRRPDPAPPRVQRDAALSVEVRRVFDENFQVYGVRKVWRQLVREGEDVARCTVARLMRRMGLQGVLRGRRVRTTISDKAAPRPNVSQRDSNQIASGVTGGGSESQSRNARSFSFE